MKCGVGPHLFFFWFEILFQSDKRAFGIPDQDTHPFCGCMEMFFHHFLHSDWFEWMWSEQGLLSDTDRLPWWKWLQLHLHSRTSTRQTDSQVWTVCSKNICLGCDWIQHRSTNGTSSVIFIIELIWTSKSCHRSKLQGVINVMPGPFTIQVPIIFVLTLKKMHMGQISSCIAQTFYAKTSVNTGEHELL